MTTDPTLIDALVTAWARWRRQREGTPRRLLRPHRPGGHPMNAPDLLAWDHPAVITRLVAWVNDHRPAGTHIDTADVLDAYYDQHFDGVVLRLTGHTRIRLHAATSRALRRSASHSQSLADLTAAQAQR